MESDSSFSESDYTFSTSDQNNDSLYNDDSFKVDKSVKSFEGLQKFEEDKENALKEATGSKSKQKALKAYNPAPSLKDKWSASVEGKMPVLQSLVFLCFSFRSSIDP